MPSVKKIDYVNDLATKLADHPNFAIVDFASTPHKSLEELKQKLMGDSNVKLKVVKNSLFEVALLKFVRKGKLISEEDASELSSKALKGNSAVIFLETDWLSGLQSFFKTAKGYEGMVFKGGVVDGVVYFKDRLNTLAQLPSREILMAKILGSLRSPQYGLVRALKWDAGRFVRVINAIKEKNS